MLPAWIESAVGLVGQLKALPLRMTQRAVTAAAYVSFSFAATVAELFDLGIVKPLRELSESKLQKIKSTDIADAAEAHNNATLKRAEAAKFEAEARKLDAEAEVELAKARAIDGELELKRLAFEQGAAERRRSEARDRLADAAAKLRAQGGELYLGLPGDDDENEPPDALPPASPGDQPTPTGGGA